MAETAPKRGSSSLRGSKQGQRGPGLAQFAESPGEQTDGAIVCCIDSDSAFKAVARLVQVTRLGVKLSQSKPQRGVGGLQRHSAPQIFGRLPGIAEK